MMAYILTALSKWPLPVNILMTDWKSLAYITVTKSSAPCFFLSSVACCPQSCEPGPDALVPLSCYFVVPGHHSNSSVQEEN